MKLKLSCLDSNAGHTRFIVFDTHGANCGIITISTQEEDLIALLNSWSGPIEWHGIDPWEHFKTKERAK